MVGTNGDELHQVCFVWDSLYFSFISESQLFWKEYSLGKQVFSPRTLSVSVGGARLLVVVGELMRHRSFSHDAAVCIMPGGLQINSPPWPNISLVSSFLVYMPHVI